MYLRSSLTSSLAQIANNGVILSPAALKATQFVQLCEQRGIPLVFLVNISGFMVGKDAEKGVSVVSFSRRTPLIHLRRAGNRQERSQDGSRCGRYYRSQVHCYRRWIIRSRKLRNGRTSVSSIRLSSLLHAADISPSRRYDPRFLWMWPNARVSVMGGDQLQDVMSTISE